MKQHSRIEVFLSPGEYFVGDARHRVRTLLGSCVSITLWHPGQRVGAMSHFLLAARGCPHSAAQVPDACYGDEALQLMVLHLTAMHVPLSGCEAKVFGGGDMFPGRGLPYPVGRRNGDAAIALLQEHGIPVVSESLFGAGHRRIVFDIASGDVWSQRVEPAEPVTSRSAAVRAVEGHA